MNKMRVRTAGLILALGGFGLALGSAQAAPMTVSDLGAFNAAVGTAPVTLDTFEGSESGDSITFNSGVISTVADGDHVSSDNGFGGGDFIGSVGPDGFFAPLSLTWTFPVPVIGFLMDFEGIDVAGARITILGTGVFFDLQNELGGSNGTFGLIDNMTPFTQIQFSVASGGTPDIFTADNLRFAAASGAAAVPEPGTLALFGLGLAGFALTRRRKGPA